MSDKQSQPKGEPWTVEKLQSLYEHLSLYNFFERIVETLNASIGADAGQALSGRRCPVCGDRYCDLHSQSDAGQASEDAREWWAELPLDGGAGQIFTNSRQLTKGGQLIRVREVEYDPLSHRPTPATEEEARLAARGRVYFPPAATDDTKRLETIKDLAEQADTDGLTIGRGCYWSLNIGSERISEGATLNEAIDAAMRKDK